MDNTSLTVIAYILISLGCLGGILLSWTQAKGATDDRDLIIRKNDSTIASLQNKLEEQNEFNRKYISGGDAYPRIDIVPISGVKGKMSFQLANNFDLPIYDIKVEVYDFDKLKTKIVKVKGMDDSINQTDFINSLLFSAKESTMTPHTIRGGVYTSDIREANLYIKSFTKNKVLIQKITIYRYKGNFHVGMEILEDGNLKKLERIYSKDVPEEIKNTLDKRLELMPDILNLTW